MVDTAPLLAHFAKYIKLTADEEQRAISYFAPTSLHKKTVLLIAGDVCTRSYFVCKGCLRSYTLNEAGEEHVLSFSPAGWWMADMYSLVSGKPGFLHINVLEDADVWILSKEKQEALFESIPLFERFFRILVERSLVAYQQRVIDSKTLTAEERYLKFCHYYPTLIDTLPQKQIASFIGVTPEFFSTMRTRLLHRK